MGGKDVTIARLPDAENTNLRFLFFTQNFI